MSNKLRRKIGDRKDAKLVRKIDGIHLIVPLIHPNRCDNEAFVSERIDLTNINTYLEKLNADKPEFKYTIFHIVVTAIIRCITLRPKMNRFIANNSLYEKNDISAAFTIKKQFEDEAREGLAFIRADENTNLKSVHESIRKQVTDCRKGKVDASSNVMDILTKFPRPITRFIGTMARWLDKHGKLPESLIETDPYHSSVVLTNLGSIKLKSGYHHLTNWGTNSVFVIIGEKKFRPVFNDDGSFEMKDTVDIGLTVDERIADGYYFSKTIKLLKKLLENPELLEEPASTPVEY
jgi:pyruvate/2-oxoglutarate dehydrogenase complex dihydrolipoamide acyltransferase (E2) component